MKSRKAINIIRSLLVLLFVYTATAKWIDIPTFRASLELQPFPKTLINTLTWLVPVSETVAAILLLFNPTRATGLMISLGILLAFTLYALLVLVGYFPYQPCGCGGIVSHMTWEQHLVFNLSFVILTISALVLEYKQRKNAGKKILQSGVAEYL